MVDLYIFGSWRANHTVTGDRDEPMEVTGGNAKLQEEAEVNSSYKDYKDFVVVIFRDRSVVQMSDSELSTGAVQYSHIMLHHSTLTFHMMNHSTLTFQ